MALKRVILELGTGNDLHGGDYTKAALRAVQDALARVRGRLRSERDPIAARELTRGVPGSAWPIL